MTKMRDTMDVVVKDCSEIIEIVRKLKMEVGNLGSSALTMRGQRIQSLLTYCENAAKDCIAEARR